MSIGPTGGIVGSAAGAPLSQTKGSDAERTVEETAQQLRRDKSNESSEKAAGIGKTDEDQEVSDRDADGRRIWEIDEKAKHEEHEDEEEPQANRQSRDASGDSGNALDLSG